jgi:hypothetical protein
MICRCNAARFIISSEPLEIIIPIICRGKINIITDSSKKNIIVAVINVEYNLLTVSDGFSFSEGISLEKIATVALWKGPPTPPNSIKDNAGI